jgi:hypothetical protein
MIVIGFTVVFIWRKEGGRRMNWSGRMRKMDIETIICKRRILEIVVREFIKAFIAFIGV